MCMRIAYTLKTPIRTLYAVHVKGINFDSGLNNETKCDLCNLSNVNNFETLSLINLTAKQELLL